MEFKDLLLENLSEAHKHQVLYITSEDAQTLEAQRQLPGGAGVYVPSSMETPPQTQLIAILNVGTFSHTLLGTLVPSILPRKHLFRSVSSLE